MDGCGGRQRRDGHGVPAAHDQDDYEGKYQQLTRGEVNRHHALKARGVRAGPVPLVRQTSAASSQVRPYASKNPNP